MLFFQDGEKIRYSNTEYTGFAIDIKDFHTTSTPVNILCDLANWYLNREYFIEEYKKNLGELTKNPTLHDDILKDYGFSQVKTLGDIILRSITLALYAEYCAFSAWIMHSYLAITINKSVMIRDVVNSKDSIADYLECINSEVFTAIGEASSLAEQILSFSDFFDSISHLPQLIAQQKITYSVLPVIGGSAMPMHEIENGDILSLLFFIYSGYVVSDRKISTCKKCGRLFVPTVRKKEVYCTHKNEKGKTCKEIGYESTLDPIDKLYRDAYKSKNVCKNRKMESNPSIQKAFDKWVRQAQVMKNDVRLNKVSMNEYREFLGSKLK